MTDVADRKREPPISYRPPTGRRAELRAAAARAGLSLNSYITSALFGLKPPRQSRRPPVELQTLARIHADIAAIRRQLDDLRTVAGEQAAAEPALDKVCADIRAAATAILLLAGRKP